MLAWGLPSGVSGACDNTLIPEWRCPVKRPSQDPGEHRANGINVHTSICDLHPGDNGERLPQLLVQLGSPPHAWGQLCPLLRRGLDDRFTPTCVGTMVRSCPRAWRSAVHPHMRGDNGLRDRFPEVLPGSPPHAWGQCWLPGQPARLPWFTPTCVGTIRTR